MREVKKYFILAGLVVLLVGVKVMLGFDSLSLNKDYDGSDGQKIKHFIANTVNLYGLDVVKNGVEIPWNDIYVTEDLKMLISPNDIRDFFDAQVLEYPDKIVINKNGDLCVFDMRSGEATLNGEPINAVEDNLPEVIDDKTYLPFAVLAKSFAKDNWTIESNRLTFDTDKLEIPEFYDSRSSDRKTAVRNQGLHGTCWAFASLTSLQIGLEPKEEVLFSPQHMAIGNSFERAMDLGGAYTMGMAYLVNWQGPVYEADCPYGESVTRDIDPVKHVQQVKLYNDKNFDAIKEAVYKYGAVQTSIYTPSVSMQVSTRYYNSKDASFCYKGNEQPNHEIVIIGWDDNYSKYHFGEIVEGDGAFLCQNSWGENAGQQGYFYVSYYDSNVANNAVCYSGIESVNNYDNIYQSDLCGWVGDIGFGTEEAYCANVYKTERTEVLKAIGLYATGDNTEYEIYVVKNFNDKYDLIDKKVTVEKGVIKNKGYNTIPIKDVYLDRCESFAVVCRLKVPGSEHPIAVEYQAGDLTKHADLTDGEGYLSSDGSVWTRSERDQGCNVCLKVYTDNF